MRRSLLIILAIVIVGGVGIFFFEPSQADSLNIGCSLSHEVRSQKLSPTLVVLAHNELSPLIDGAIPMAARLTQLEGLVCNTTLRPESRLLALDFLYENRAILEVLQAQQSHSGSWENKLTGTYGAVQLVGKKDSQTHTCALIDYPSVMPSIDPNVITTVREVFCRPKGTDSWFSHQVIETVGERVAPTPKNYT